MPAIDNFSTWAVGMTGAATRGEEVTPSDASELAYVTRALWVGGAGDLEVVTHGGDELTLVGVQAGTMIPLRVKQVKATGTTATSIVGLF